ncbi:hypothetical protein [Dehalobacter restrictus]
MAKKQKRIDMYADKVKRLIDKGLIAVSEILDTDVKTAYQSKKGG